jgi:hypothetical protein
VGRGAAEGDDGRPRIEVTQSARIVNLADNLGDREAAGDLTVGLDIIDGDHGEVFADACEGAG